MVILGIETSCDETAAAIVQGGISEVSSSLASSVDVHMLTGGVVPEVAARMQLESIVPVIQDTLEKATSHFNETDSQAVKKHIDAIAVTAGPGLIGSLLVGVHAAKALALSWQKPLVPVNHLVGHIYGNFIGLADAEEIQFPSVVLIVSGGHTDLVLMHGHGHFEYLGGTLDDAAGEAFDKTARLLGIADYLGGPPLSRKAAECTNNTLAGELPRPKITDIDYDFSFSGLKTAVKNLTKQNDSPIEVIACEFETAVVDVLVAKTIRAAKSFSTKSILLGGGVSANIPLRTRFQLEADNLGIPVFMPELRLCNDNAIYIASAAYFNYYPKALGSIKANPALGIMD